MLFASIAAQHSLALFSSLFLLLCLDSRVAIFGNLLWVFDLRWWGGLVFLLKGKSSLQKFKWFQILVPQNYGFFYLNQNYRTNIYMCSEVFNQGGCHVTKIAVFLCGVIFFWRINSFWTLSFGLRPSSPPGVFLHRLRGQVLSPPPSPLLPPFHPFTLSSP